MDVARAGYESWDRNQRVLVTGMRNDLMATLVPFVPRTRLLKLVRNVQSRRQ